MKTSSPWVRAVVWLAGIGLLLPQSVMASVRPSPPPALRTVDAVLGPGGTLDGTLVDPQGAGVAQARVIVLQGSSRFADTSTDDHGRFTVTLLRPGVYVVAAAGTVKPVRLWNPATAPPAAARGVLLVSDEAAMRAQGGDWYQWISEHYVLFCCSVATAIALPVCLVASNQHHRPVSP